jgi:hypothetical protein
MNNKIIPINKKKIIYLEILQNSLKPISKYECILCNFVVISPNNKCIHSYCDFCLRIIKYIDNKCIICRLNS